MHKKVSIIRMYRTQIAEIAATLTVDQLNSIPAGFNNNIIWHIGHLLVTLPGMSYRPAGLAMPVETKLWHAFKPGSFPGVPVSEEEVAVIRELLLSSLDQLEKDLTSKRFVSYTPWVARTGVSVDSMEDALELITFHEGLHTGYILSLRKLVS